MRDLLGPFDCKIRTEDYEERICSALHSSLIVNHDQLEILESDLSRTKKLFQKAPDLYPQAFEWCDFDGLAHTIASLNAPSIFEQIFSNICPRSLNRFLDTHNRIHTLEKLALENSQSNSGFYTAVVCGAFFAGLAGNTLRRLFVGNADFLINPQPYIELSNQLPGETSSFAQYRERLIQIFGSDNYYKVLLHQKSFIGEHGAICPSIQLTKLIFKSYSRLLCEPDYISILETNLEKNA